MKFNELREANLSKAQINKVHDKADEMPKSDFIKRYGKEGDAVRFATATNIVKKQLGIGESRIMGLNTKSVEYKNGRAAAEKGVKYEKNPHSPGTKRLNWSMGHNDFRADNLRKAGKPNYGARGQFEALDKEDEKSIGDVIKGLKKAVKSHQGQVKSLTKDIKDEVELTEKKANYIDIKLNSTNDLKRMMVWLDKNISPVNNELYDNAAQEGQSIIQFEDVPNVDKLMQKLKSARINFKVDTMEGGPGSGPQHGEITITKNGKSKKVKRPALSIFKKAGWKQEEVVTEAVSDGQVAQAKRMTDKNDHFGARKYLASIIRDKEMMQMYDSLEKMHRMDLGGNDALTLRGKLDKNLKFRLTQKLKKDAKRLLDAL